MDFETVERCGRVYVVKNGVESAAFVMPSYEGQTIYQPEPWGEYKSLNAALNSIALHMDTWYTATEAAAHLVEMGVFDKPPSSQRVTKWCREGLLPGAMKVAKRGSGGAWRILGAALQAFANERREQ